MHWLQTATQSALSSFHISIHHPLWLLIYADPAVRSLVFLLACLFTHLRFGSAEREAFWQQGSLPALATCWAGPRPCTSTLLDQKLPKGKNYLSGIYLYKRQFRQVSALCRVCCCSCRITVKWSSFSHFLGTLTPPGCRDQQALGNFHSDLLPLQTNEIMPNSSLSPVPLCSWLALWAAINLRQTVLCWDLTWFFLSVVSQLTPCSHSMDLGRGAQCHLLSQKGGPTAFANLPSSENPEAFLP